ncbi:MAG TPA: hypothetical protein VMZ52_04620 [Bryobacteraceae bacterium]|nr:hypothetical protein [Bryobacteraceae bacterium]
MNQTMKLLALGLCILCAVMAAEGVAGKWSGQVPSRNSAAEATFIFKVDGDKLTGTLSGPQGEVELQDGKVSANQISFSVPGGNAKVAFEGKVSGDQIKMTRTREGGQAREFTLKRAQ